MQRISHTLVTLLLAAWLPFCCCQARAAMHAVVAKAAQTSDEGDECCSHCCCSDKPATDDATSDAGERCPADKSGGCCTSCKDRVLPASTTVPPADEIGTDWIACAFTLHSDAPIVVASSVGPGHATGPPGVRAGRDILQQSSILLV